MINDEFYYYVYYYADPTKKGEYKYGDYIFPAEPFYIGRGKNNRCASHLEEVLLEKPGCNLDKYYKIKEIIDNDGWPIIQFVCDDLELEESIALEEHIIGIVGREDLNTGPLLNHTSGKKGKDYRIIERLRNG